MPRTPSAPAPLLPSPPFTDSSARPTSARPAASTALRPAPAATSPRRTLVRSRPVGIGNWRAFLAVAEHLNFRAAAEVLSLTQSAVSRQIQALEDEVGLPLFLRHTRAVELTGAGGQLLRVCGPSIGRMDAAVRLVRQSAGRKSVGITTWASFASMWLIPRMESFQHDNPDIDLRIDASDGHVDLDTTDVDLALRYCMPGARHQSGERLFGEQLAVVASPWLIKSMGAPSSPADLARFTLIEAGDLHRAPNAEWLTWQRWFAEHDCAELQPKRWLYFNYAHQIVQAALSGQGLALARVPLITDALTAGDLLEVMPGFRIDTPLGYWLLLGPRSVQRPEVQAFCAWLSQEAALTRQAIGEALNAAPLE